MTDVTTTSMCDARDAEDKRLLDNGEIDLLLAGWLETIVARCALRLRDAEVGRDAAQVVCERLWRELKAGRHRDGRWPFRVIVHNVVDWTCSGWYEQRWGEHELIDVDGAAPDDFTGDVVLQLTLEQFVATLPPGDGEVGRLALIEHLEPAQIAERLGKDPNAVYQARFRVVKRLREWLEA
jgi:DNA-directed RNA polymerase specialized sigma24 family protein